MAVVWGNNNKKFMLSKQNHDTFSDSPPFYTNEIFQEFYFTPRSPYLASYRMILTMSALSSKIHLKTRERPR